MTGMREEAAPIIFPINLSSFLLQFEFPARFYTQSSPMTWTRKEAPRLAIQINWSSFLLQFEFSRHSPASWRARERMQRSALPTNPSFFSFTVWISRQVLHTVQPHGEDEKRSATPSHPNKFVVFSFRVWIFPPDFTHSPALVACTREDAALSIANKSVVIFFYSWNFPPGFSCTHNPASWRGRERKRRA